MQVNKKQLEKSQVELKVELPLEDFQKYFEKGAEEISKEIKIEGFRQGKAPFDVVKKRVGDGPILEKAARIAINDTLPEAMKEIEGTPIDRPSVDITKLAADNPLEYKVVVTLLPEVKLGDYKNLDVKKEKVKVSDEEIQNYIDYLQDSKAQEALVDREVKKGDKVTLNIERFVDKKSLNEKEKEQDINIIVGKEQIVKGFDENILGAKKDQVLDFSLTYPEDSHNKQLAGKKLDFKVTVKSVYERKLPEINDDFAKSLGFESLEKFKESLKETAKNEKEQHASRKMENKILEKIVQNSEFGEIPESLVNQESEKMLEELEREITSQGGNLENYLSQIDKTKEQIKEEFKPQAIKRIKTALCVREIIQKENIKVSNEDIENRRKELLERYKGYQKAEEHINKPEYAEQLNNMLTNEKLMEKLKSWNKAKEKEEPKKTKKQDKQSKKV